MTKKFAWSHSRLSQFEICPRRHYEVDIAKNVVEEPSAAMTFGSNLHKALELYGRDGTPLPPEFRSYQDVADRVVALPGWIQYENKLAITREFEPCAFFADDVWFRCVVDVLVIEGKLAAALDYKTGKKKPNPDQLQLNAATIFAWHPDVEQVETRYWWLTKGKDFTSKTYRRHELPDIWNKFLPRVKKYEQAIETGKFPPNPGGLCKKWCPVTSCQFNGRG